MKKDLFDFLNNSPTQYHATAQMIERLESAGFSALSECDEWKLKPGDCRYVVRENSSVIAFQVGNDMTAGFQIATAHTDSPVLKLRTAAIDNRDLMMRIPTDVYGGMIYSSWFDRPLGIAGIVCDRLVRTSEAVAMIPNPPPHLMQEGGNGLKYNVQSNMAALIADCSEQEELLHLLGVEPDLAGVDFPPSELYLYDVSPAVKLSGELINAPRLDNLLSCYCAVSGLISVCSSNEPSADFTRCMACFDAEEIGSVTRAGAKGNFLETVLKRIVLSQAHGKTDEIYLRALAASIILSLDAAHAENSNYAGLFDPAYSAKLGEGVVLKRNISQCYATHYSGERFIRSLADDAGLYLQNFEVPSAARCGSTVGPWLSAHLGIVTVDLGIAMWAMHSLRETASLRDVRDLQRLLATFWKSSHEE